MRQKSDKLMNNVFIKFILLGNTMPELNLHFKSVFLKGRMYRSTETVTLFLKIERIASFVFKILTKSFLLSLKKLVSIKLSFCFSNIPFNDSG